MFFLTFSLCYLHQKMCFHQVFILHDYPSDDTMHSTEACERLKDAIAGSASTVEFVDDPISVYGLTYEQYMDTIDRHTEMIIRFLRKK